MTIPDSCSGLRLDHALARLFNEFSRSRLTNWIKNERVHLNGLPASPSQKVWAGDLVHVEPQVPLAEDVPADIALKIVYEDDALLVIDKPPALVVHPGAGNPSSTLLNALLHHSSILASLPRGGIVHRLDKDTSGLLVVAKTAFSQERLIMQLKARSVSREYLALMHGRLPAKGKIEAPIGRHPRNRTLMAVVATGRFAATYYQAVERFRNCTLAKVSLATGRTHQIRVHMQSISHPIVGDPVYGLKAPPDKLLAQFPRQALHAAQLRFIHPTLQREVAFTSEPPDDMQSLLKQLREQIKNNVT